MSELILDMISIPNSIYSISDARAKVIKYKMHNLWLYK